MSKFIYFLILITFIVSSCTTSKDNFPYDDSSYSLNSLKLGVAFPPVTNQESIEWTVEKLNGLKLKSVVIHKTTSTGGGS